MDVVERGRDDDNGDDSEEVVAVVVVVDVVAVVVGLNLRLPISYQSLAACKVCKLYFTWTTEIFVCTVDYLLFPLFIFIDWPSLPFVLYPSNVHYLTTKVLRVNDICDECMQLYRGAQSSLEELFRWRPGGIIQRRLLGRFILN